MTITVFFDEKDFFGNLEMRSCTSESLCKENLRTWLNKCFQTFGKKHSFSFRVDIENKESDRYLVECNYIDASNGVYSVTHIFGYNNYDSPEKMTKQAFIKKMLSVYDKMHMAAA